MSCICDNIIIQNIKQKIIFKMSNSIRNGFLDHVFQAEQVLNILIFKNVFLLIFLLKICYRS